MVLKRHPEPLLWMLFSAGGVVSGMLMPILALILTVAIPMGWIAAPSYDRMVALLSNPLVRIVLFALCVLSLLHWAHRFRYTLYDGLQIKHLNEVVALLTYGIALAGSIAAAYLLLQTPA